MANLDQLLNDIANQEAQQDFERLRLIRQQIVDEHPSTEEAAEAQYKIGLDLLFRERKINDAVQRFEAVVKRKVPDWSEAARTSMALCMFHQGRTQKAALELRKVAYRDKPNAHSVVALGFLEMFAMNKGQFDEGRRIRKDRIYQLETLISEARESGDINGRGYYLYLLGMALVEQNEGDRASEVFAQAKELGPDALGSELYESVVGHLAQI